MLIIVVHWQRLSAQLHCAVGQLELFILDEGKNVDDLGLI